MLRFECGYFAFVVARSVSVEPQRIRCSGLQMRPQWHNRHCGMKNYAQNLTGHRQSTLLRVRKIHKPLSTRKRREACDLQFGAHSAEFKYSYTFKKAIHVVYAIIKAQSLTILKYKLPVSFLNTSAALLSIIQS